MRGFARGFGALWRVFQIISTVMERSAHTAAIIMLYGMWGLLFLNALSRWLGSSLGVAWSLEIVGYMIAWSIFVMIGPVAKWHRHVKMVFLPVKLLGERRGNIFMRLSENLTGLGICLYMTIHAYRWIDMTRDMGMKSQSVGGWFYPMWIVRLAVLIGFILLCLFYFERTVEQIRSFMTRGVGFGEFGSGEAAASEAKGDQTSASATEGSARGDRS